MASIFLVALCYCRPAGQDGTKLKESEESPVRQESEESPIRQEPEESPVRIVSPKPGEEVGAAVTVRVTGVIEDGNQLWLFLRREDFEPFWWPQSRLQQVKPGVWQGRAHTGAPHDVGWAFEIAVATFGAETSKELENFRRTAMRSGSWAPIEMPETTSVVSIVKVLKVGHP